jgi:hypothetical protein
MNERNDLIAAVDQPLDVGLNLAPAADPVTKVDADRLLAPVGGGVG